MPGTPLKLNASTKLLFIGDSITDCGRREDPEAVGDGYVRLVRDWLRAADPANAPASVINMGVSGNKVTDLQKRWQRDVIDQGPDVVSVMIGINDVWHGLAPDRAGVDIETYLRTYREILMELRARCPACRLILCEPTVISPPAPAPGNEKLEPYVRAVNDLAADFVADFVVKVHDVFRSAERLRPEIEWTTDGVHPTSAGHALIARTWLSTTGLV
jgi:lysophospholipase L1-like esterase